MQTILPKNSPRAKIAQKQSLETASAGPRPLCSCRGSPVWEKVNAIPRRLTKGLALLKFPIKNVLCDAIIVTVGKTKEKYRNLKSLSDINVIVVDAEIRLCNKNKIWDFMFCIQRWITHKSFFNWYLWVQGVLFFEENKAMVSTHRVSRPTIRWNKSSEWGWLWQRVKQVKRMRLARQSQANEAARQEGVTSQANEAGLTEILRSEEKLAHYW